MKKLILGMALGVSAMSSYAASYTYQHLVTCLMKDNVCVSYKPIQGPIINNGAKPWFYPEQGKDYGIVPIGSNRVRSFLVANIGTGPLTVYGFDKGSLVDEGMEQALSAVKYNPTSFRLTTSDCPLDGPFVLGVNATCTLKVKFVPSTTDKVGDVLKMLHSSAEVGAVVQDIYGEGQAIVPGQNPGSDGTPTTGGPVDSNTPANPDVTPEMAKVALQFSAKSLKFGEVPKDSTPVPLSVILTNVLEEDLAFSSKRMSNGWFKFTDNCGPVLPAKGSCTFQITMDTSKVVKPSSDDIFTVQFKEGAVGTVALTGLVLGENIVASPNPAEVIGYGLDQDSNAPVVLTNTGTGSATISNITVTDAPTGEVLDLGGFLATTPGQEDNPELSALIDLGGFTPSNPSLVKINSHNCGTLPADGSCTVDLSIKSPEEVDTVKYINYSINGKTYSIKVKAKVAEADLAITPNILDWGVVPFYSSTEKVMTLTNIGGKPVSGIRAVLPPSFSVKSTTCGSSLAPDATCTYTFKFSPEETMSANTVRDANILNTGDITNIPFKVKGGGEGPVIYASSTSLNFGKVNPQQGYPINKITLRNEGTSSANINDIKVLGDNFVVSGSTCGTTLASKASCEVQVQLNTSVNGQATDTLEINTNSLKSAKLSVNLKADVNGAILVATPEKISFGEVAYGSVQKQTAIVSNQGNMPVKLLAVNGSSYRMGITSTCTTGKTLAPKETCEITFNMDTTEGSRDGASGGLSIGSDAAKSSLSVSATGIGKGSYAVVPASATAPLTKVGQSSYAVATIGNAAYQPFTISSIALNADSPNASQWSEATHNCVNIGYNQSCTIRAKFTPNSYGSKPSSISFQSNDARYSTGNITLNGDGMDGDIAFYVDGTLTKSFNFGSLAFNSGASKTVSMYNVGVQTTKVNSVSSSSGAWSSTGCVGQTLAPGAGCNFTVSSSIPYVAGNEVQSMTTFTFSFDKALSTGFSTYHRAIGSWPLVSNTAVSFAGSTPYNVTKTQNITITNTGNRVLEVSNWKVANDPLNEVSVSSTNCGTVSTINGTCTATITYTAKKDGPVAAIITAQTNSQTSAYSTTKGELKINVAATSAAALPKLSLNMTGTAVAKNRTLYLYNAGSSGLTFQSMTLNMTQGTGSLPNGYTSCPALSAKAYCAVPITLQGENLAGTLNIRITGAAGSNGNGTFSLPLVADPSVYPISNDETIDFPGAHPTVSNWYATASHGRVLSDGDYSTTAFTAYKSGDHYYPGITSGTVYGQSINKLVASVKNIYSVPLILGVYDRSSNWSGANNILLGSATVPANYEGLVEVRFPTFNALQAPPSAWPWFDKFWGIGATYNGKDTYLLVKEMRVGNAP